MKRKKIKKTAEKKNICLTVWLGYTGQAQRRYFRWNAKVVCVVVYGAFVPKEQTFVIESSFLLL